MSETLPSKAVAIVDVPEPEEVRAQFVYNFFLRDEDINEVGTVSSDILAKPGETFNEKYVDTISFKRSTARYVKLSWSPVVVTNQPKFSDTSANKTRTDIKVSIKNNLGKINYEEDLAQQRFTSIHVQETNVKALISDLVQNGYRIISTQNATLSNAATPNQMIKSLNALLPKGGGTVKNPALFGDFFSQEAFSYRTLRGENEETLEKTISNVRTSLQINNKVIADVFDSSIVDAIGTFANENQASSNTIEAVSIQQSAQNNDDSTLISNADYDTRLEKSIKKINIDPASYDPIMQTLGYVIDKTRILPDGTLQTYAPIVVQSDNANTTVDLNVFYGGNYFYQVRTVAYVEIQAYDPEEGVIGAIGFLVASKPVRTEVVTCEEFIPPPSPTDFQVRWDYRLSAPRLEWSFPTNTQRDIKYFQIFKRLSINEPFRLVKLYDFNDSFTPRMIQESLVDPLLVQKQTSPLANYLDLEFKPGESWIYSLACVDAHGISSTYAEQYQIKFNTSKNALEVVFISVSGAEKCYPNMFLNRDTFVDSIKTEGYRKLRVVFNPENLRVSDSQKNNLNLLRGTDLDSYKLQMINIDNQQQQVFTINIKDRTSFQLGGDMKGSFSVGDFLSQTTNNQSIKFR